MNTAARAATTRSASPPTVTRTILVTRFAPLTHPSMEATARGTPPRDSVRDLRRRGDCYRRSAFVESVGNPHLVIGAQCLPRRVRDAGRSDNTDPDENEAPRATGL